MCPCLPFRHLTAVGLMSPLWSDPDSRNLPFGGFIRSTPWERFHMPEGPDSEPPCRPAARPHRA